MQASHLRGAGYMVQQAKGPPPQRPVDHASVDVILGASLPLATLLGADKLEWEYVVVGSRDYGL